MIRHCCRCGSQVTPSGVCIMNQDHASPDVDDELVCACGNIKHDFDDVCSDCRFAAMADNPLTERD